MTRLYERPTSTNLALIQLYFMCVHFVPLICSPNLFLSGKFMMALGSYLIHGIIAALVGSVLFLRYLYPAQVCRH